MTKFFINYSKSQEFLRQYRWFLTSVLEFPPMPWKYCSL